MQTRPNTHYIVLYYKYYRITRKDYNGFCILCTHCTDQNVYIFSTFSTFVYQRTQVIIIHSSDTDGRAILGRFQTTSQTNYDDIDVRATVESIIEFEPKLDTFGEHLIDMKSAQSRVYLLYAK